MKKSFLLILLALGLNINSQWVNQNVLPKPPALYSVYAYSSQIAWASGDSGKVLLTTNGGTSWLYRDSSVFNNHPVISIQAIGPQTALCICNIGGTGKIFKTVNAGSNWFQVFSRNGVVLNDIEFMNPTTGFVYGNPVSNFWYVLKTTDGGNTFDSTTITRPPAVSPSDIGFPNDQYVIDNAGQGYIWFGTSNFRTYFSTNSGLTWNNSQTPGNQFIFSITFVNTQTGFAGGQNNAFITNNGANNWLPMPPLPGAGPFFSFANAGGFVWYARGNCIYYSTNMGASFVQQHCSPDNSIYNHLSFTFSPGNNPMSVITGWGVTSNGVISKYIYTSGIEKIGNEIPSEYKLEQNYPNPFNPVTKIRFYIPSLEGVRGRNIQLLIYNVPGREIEAIVNENLQPGVYEAEWDASNYPSGVYFYILSAGEFTQTRKMILIK